MLRDEWPHSNNCLAPKGSLKRCGQIPPCHLFSRGSQRTQWGPTVAVFPFPLGCTQEILNIHLPLNTFLLILVSVLAWEDKQVPPVSDITSPAIRSHPESCDIICWNNHEHNLDKQFMARQMWGGLAPNTRNYFRAILCHFFISFWNWTGWSFLFAFFESSPQHRTAKNVNVEK